MRNEANCRLDRRLLGMLAVQLDRIDIENDITDPRTKQGNVIHDLRKILTATMIGIAAGRHGFAEMEGLTTAMGAGARRLLGLPQRVPDTTASDVVVRLKPWQLRKVLRKLVRVALRAKRIEHDFVLRAVAMDGKGTSTFVMDAATGDEKIGQVNSATGKSLVRTVTSCLISTPARVCIDACPIPANTNECGVFETALDDLLAAYGRSLFDVVLYDSGAASLANASLVVARDLSYVFILDQFQPTLYTEAKRMLGSRKAATAQAHTTDLDGSDIVERHLWLTDKMAGYLDWSHLQTVIRTHTIRTDKTTGAVRTEDRYYVSNLLADKVTAAQWQEMIRRRWSVENQNHNTLDSILREDKRPWLKRPNGMLVMHFLRRIVYNLLAIFRSVTTRSETKRAKPWKALMQGIYDAAIRATRQTVEGLRQRAVALS